MVNLLCKVDGYSADKNIYSIKEAKASLLCSQKTTIGTYLEPV
jgi:hypothetical protein